MPRNGSGTYTLPAGNPVVTGTVISSTVHNNTMSDIADEITNSVDKDGQTVITGSIDMNGNAIVLDADGDSKIEVATDDRFDLTLNNVLSLSLTSAEALKLDAIADLAVTDGNFIVANGTTFVAESGATARASLGVDLSTKGTILVGDGSAPDILSPGTNGQVLAYDSAEPLGMKPIDLPDSARDYQAFTSSGTWTKPTGAEFIYAEVWSGGGGGANNTASSTNEMGGSGGEFVSGWFRASALGATETVTVGAGGAGAANGAVADGSTGGASSFGTWLAAVGGNPGKQTSANTYATVPRSAVAFLTDGALAGFISDQAGVGFTGAGGKTIYGGGGGGGSDTGGSTGGTSAYGGNGGGGNNTLNTPGTAGTAPAGGGGGSGNNGGGGAGARGEVRVWTW